MAERIRNIRKTNYPELFLLAFTLKILRLHREKLLFSWILCILIAPKFSKEIQKTCLDVARLYKYSKLHQGTCLGLHKPVIIIDCQLMCCPKLCVQLALYKNHFSAYFSFAWSLLEGIRQIRRPLFPPWRSLSF